MREPSVRITPGGRVVIDTGAWIARRIRAPRPDLVADLRAWVESFDPPDDGDTVTDWTSVTQAWCAARGHDVREPGLIVHEQTRLDARLWVLLLDAADGSQVAVVGINDNQPSGILRRHVGAVGLVRRRQRRHHLPGRAFLDLARGPRTRHRRPAGPPPSPRCSGPTWTPRSPPARPAPPTTTAPARSRASATAARGSSARCVGSTASSACPTRKPSDQHPAPAGQPPTPARDST